VQFEYQQAQLEAEIENLSWKVERADSYDRGVSVLLASACWPDVYWVEHFCSSTKAVK